LFPAERAGRQDFGPPGCPSASITTTSAMPASLMPCSIFARSPTTIHVAFAGSMICFAAAFTSAPSAAAHPGGAWSDLIYCLARCTG